ncbi:DUF6961 family protein [Tsuneonella litorea]|uniref:DUF6961 family protein n=1 Tax=Tsuneonella litorea TaxID=2976475 RepID=UPI0035CCEDC4
MLPLGSPAGIVKDRYAWAMALWIERHHGPDGSRFVAVMVGWLAAIVPIVPTSAGLIVCRFGRRFLCCERKPPRRPPG